MHLKFIFYKWIEKVKFMAYYNKINYITTNN